MAMVTQTPSSVEAQYG